MIIGFTGKAGGGKDESGKYLIEEYDYVKLSFATPLKDMLAAMGYPEPATLEGKQAAIHELGCSWRHLAQTLGTEWGRELIHPDLWVRLAAETIRLNPDRNFVITDLRFENEATMVRELRGQVVHLKGRAGRLDGHTAQHVSEEGLQICGSDTVVHNDVEGIDILRSKLKLALRMHL